MQGDLDSSSRASRVAFCILPLAAVPEYDTVQHQMQKCMAFVPVAIFLLSIHPDFTLQLPGSLGAPPKVNGGAAARAGGGPK